MLFSPVTPTMPSMPVSVAVPWPWIITMAALSALVFSVAVGAGLRAQRTKVTVGANTMLGATGVARSALDPQGIVLVQAEEWTAMAAGSSIVKGAAVQVVGREGVTLRVRAIDPEQNA
jgi:membrane-bound serine protease (ClpP class)